MKASLETYQHVENLLQPLRPEVDPIDLLAVQETLALSLDREVFETLPEKCLRQRYDDVVAHNQRLRAQLEQLAKAAQPFNTYRAPTDGEREKLSEALSQLES